MEFVTVQIPKGVDGRVHWTPKGGCDFLYQTEIEGKPASCATELVPSELAPKQGE